MMQMQKYKGATAKQGLLSILATSHCYTIWHSKAVPLSEMEWNSSRKSCSKLTSCLGLMQGGDLSWPIPQEIVCRHHQIAVLAQKVKTTQLPPLLQTWRKQTQTGLGGNKAINRVLLPAGWVGVFWHSQPIPKRRISSQRVGRIPVPGNNWRSKAGAWGYFLPWRDSKGKLLQTSGWRGVLVFVPDGDNHWVV